MPGLIRGVARTAAIAGTATAVSGRVQRRQQNRWAAKDQQQYAEQQPQQYAEQQQPQYAEPAPQYAPPPPPPPPPPAEPVANDMDAKLAQLKQLGELKDAGVLSEMEFEVQKNKILSS